MATFLDVHRQVSRWMIVIVMGLGLFMNAAIPEAFDDRAWAFVIPLLAILFFAGSVTALAARTDALCEHFRRTLIWMTARCGSPARRSAPAAAVVVGRRSPHRPHRHLARPPAARRLATTAWFF
ncbi:low temperature requirement protein A [Streptomyces sp. NPDC060232]|uniref:low temperature requirement protein A n=1 Tax=Streptomyces sp. NPDC060232 TaxID=3347079 RepID=UPI003667963D